MSLSEKPQEELAQPANGLTPAAVEPASAAAESAEAPAEEHVETTESVTAAETAAEPATEPATIQAEAADTARQAPPATREEVVERLEALAALPAEEIANDDVTRLKLQYYSLHNGWLQGVRDEWVAQGNTLRSLTSPLTSMSPASRS